MTELSPAAQAVLNAALPVYDDEHLYVAPMEKHAGMIAAAALRASAEQLHYEDRLGWTGCGYYTDFQNQIRAIASELEVQ